MCIRYNCLNHDFDKIKSIIAEGENSVNPLSVHDFLRLGKFNEHLDKPRPIIGELNWAVDASTLLSKARNLPKDIRTKPDMSPENMILMMLTIPRML